ncbi:MAG: DNA topoisomerase IV subunit A [Alphaproteobacteria bacterium]|nr:DNA topoisomerase IV subunit A [Alphaproteobacteria bacterium]MBR1756306.1 DNA topoisomerase IV subunit A [Alphaproteobacteria bacterium]
MVEENIKIKDVQFGEELSKRYLSYAMSTIVSRSLPDVRDGLKPVHRRLMYAMRQLHLDPKNGYKKCARVVGDVIGKYHPHGDSAVYGAMVRLAQDFSVRYPLVDGQGNFGNIDGDGAAAMRYTEARLTEFAMDLMDGLNDDAVEFVDTYDGEDTEPAVMPAMVPNLLCNGAMGIAVGMATNIPPHNLSEISDAMLYLIENPDADDEAMVRRIKGPDFPTGGTIVDSFETILHNYQQGKGNFRIRAKWETEDLGHGQYQIVVTEIPYGVIKSKLIEKIAELLLNKKLPFLGDVRDESAQDVRIVLEPKSRLVDAKMLMEQLYKLTDMEAKFSMNMNVLDADGVPHVMSIKEVLKAYLQHRNYILLRKINFRLNKINARLEILEGYLIAYLNLDEIIRIIREEDEPKTVMMAKFKLTDTQAEAILNMKLRNLRKLDEAQIEGEHNDLLAEKATLEILQNDEDKRWKAIAEEIKRTKEKYSKRTALGRRRTEFAEAPTDIEVPVEAMIEKEPITVILSQKGWIRALKGYADLKEDFKFKDDDALAFAIHAQTTDKIVILDNKGKFFSIAANDIPNGRGFGQPVRLMIDLANNDDVAAMFVYEPDARYLLASDKAYGFIVDENHILAQTRQGRKIMNVTDGEVVKFCLKMTGDYVAIVGENRRLLVFKAEEIPTMARGHGVLLQKYKDGSITDIQIFNGEIGFSYNRTGGICTEKELITWLGHRAQIGKLVPFGFPKNNKFLK